MRTSLAILLLLSAATLAVADPVITDMTPGCIDTNAGYDVWSCHQITWTNDATSGYYRVEWATINAMDTNWHYSWSNLNQIATPSTSAFISVGLPIHWRVLHDTNTFSAEPVVAIGTNEAEYTGIDLYGNVSWVSADTSDVFSVDWLNGTNWCRDWNSLGNIVATGVQMSAYVPMSFRLRLLEQTDTNEIRDLTGMVRIPMRGYIGRPGDQYLVYGSRCQIDRTEITIAHWNLVTAWALTNGYTDLFLLTGPDEYPAANVSWYDAIKWCNARGEYENAMGAFPVVGDMYRDPEGDPLRAGTNYASLGSYGYRLPTEREWELAARGGDTNAYFPHGGTNELDMDGEDANYWQSGDASEYYADQRCPVGGWTYNPFSGMSNAADAITRDDFDFMNDQIVLPYTQNPFGLYDMAGNVAEWCHDWHVYYQLNGTYDRYGPETGDRKVVRGGSWGSKREFCTVYHRAAERPDKRRNNIGFRCVYVEPR